MTSTPTPPAGSAAPLQAPAQGSRRAEIALVAGEEFTRRGYHWTRVDHIAERLSITPGALYRHVPGKYEMFRDAVATLATELESASTPTADRSATVEDLAEALTRCTLRHRSRVALYPWQARYLSSEHRAAVHEVDARVRRRLADAVRERRRRRGLPSPGAGPAAAAILSCVASLGHHRIDLSAAEAVRLMRSIAADLAMAPPPAHPCPGAGAGERNGPVASGSQPPRLRGGAATREGAIEAAIPRFHTFGYETVTMEAIGSDVGVAASALYRHFSGKSALLAAAVDRTAALVEDLLETHSVLGESASDPAVSLSGLLSEYTAIAFSHGPDLMLYHSELGALEAEDRRRVRQAQRRQLDRWTGLLLAAGIPAPGHAATVACADPTRVPLDNATARIRIHAALAVVLDGGQWSEFHPAAADQFRQLAEVVLLPR